MEGSGSTCLVFSAMRNEGAFLVEWVAWYRMLGFEVLVGYNDCTDRSPDLLAALEAAGWLTAFQHHPPAGRPPKQSAHRAMRARPEVKAADWLLICDVDEFLVLKEGDGTIAGYLDWARARADFLGIAFHWRNFGNSGWTHYRDGLVHRQFRRCGPAGSRTNIFFKTLFRDPTRWTGYTDHAPFGPRGRDWGDAGAVIVDAALRPIDRFGPGAGQVRFTSPEGITHLSAQMNHYVIRSDESFDLKRGRPSASALTDRYTDHFYRRRNRNGERDDCALAYAEAFDPVHDAAMALPGVRRLHHLCCADYVAALVEKAGGDPRRDSRWRHHMERAG